MQLFFFTRVRQEEPGGRNKRSSKKVERKFMSSDGVST